MKILEILSADKETQAANATQRVAKALRRKQEALIDSIEQRQEDAEATIDRLMGKTAKNIDTNSWVQDLQDAKLVVATVAVEMRVAKETLSELF